jgi:caffeoyl-CoA O-methyltransferase
MQTRAATPTLEYITRMFVREPVWVEAARAEGERRRPGMQVSSYEGYLLSWLTRMMGAKRVLEIGTFMGTSTLWLADGVGDDGHVTALEFAADYAAAAQNHIAASPHKNRVEIIHTDAHAWLAAQPLAPTYDLVFIDAEKTGYANYLDAVLPRMNPRGCIIGDNTLLFGALTGEQPDAAKPAAIAAMTRFNETLADASRFESILLPTPEGLTVARLRE